jgi:hypothetical protein
LVAFSSANKQKTCHHQVGQVAIARDKIPHNGGSAGIFVSEHSPVALRPRLSAGLPFSVEELFIYTITISPIHNDVNQIMLQHCEGTDPHAK